MVHVKDKMWIFPGDLLLFFYLQTYCKHFLPLSPCAYLSPSRDLMYLSLWSRTLYRQDSFVPRPARWDLSVVTRSVSGGAREERKAKWRCASLAMRARCDGVTQGQVKSEIFRWLRWNQHKKPLRTHSAPVLKKLHDFTWNENALSIPEPNT